MKIHWQKVNRQQIRKICLNCKEIEVQILSMKMFVNFQNGRPRSSFFHLKTPLLTKGELNMLAVWCYHTKTIILIRNQQYLRQNITKVWWKLQIIPCSFFIVRKHHGGFRLDDGERWVADHVCRNSQRRTRHSATITHEK